MVKIILICLFLISASNADKFEKNCIECHPNSMQFNMFMKRYTMKYSSEDRIKKAIFQYLKNPSAETSVMPFGFLNRFGIKGESFLEDEDLREMVDIYYQRYNIKDKIY